MNLLILAAILIIGILAVTVIALSYSLKKQRQMWRDLRVPLDVKLLNGHTVDVIVTDRQQGYKGHGFLEINVVRTAESDFESVSKVWETLLDKFVNETFTGMQRGPGYQLTIYPKKGTSLTDIVETLEQSNSAVHSCVI